MAYAVDPDGHRRLLAITLGPEESEDSWSELLEQLLERGLSGVELVIADEHAGLAAALRRFLPECAASAAPCTCNATCWPRFRIACASVWRARLPPSSGPPGSLRDALRERGRSVEVVAVFRTHGELERARTTLGRWANTAASSPATPEPGRAARCEIDRIEQAIRGMDDAVIEKHGGLQGCLKRIVELKDLLRSARPGTAIDGFTTWRSSRLPGADLDPRTAGVGGVPRVHIDIGVLVYGIAIRCARRRFRMSLAALRFAPRPQDRRCRSRGCGRGGSDPPI